MGTASPENHIQLARLDFKIDSIPGFGALESAWGRDRGAAILLDSP